MGRPNIDADTGNGMPPALQAFFAGKYKWVQAFLIQNG